MPETPLTDKFLIELDMQDLNIGHKYRELVNHAKFLEKYLNLYQKQAGEAIKQTAEAIKLVNEIIK